MERLRVPPGNAGPLLHRRWHLPARGRRSPEPPPEVIHGGTCPVCDWTGVNLYRVGDGTDSDHRYVCKRCQDKVVEADERLKRKEGEDHRDAG